MKRIGFAIAGGMILLASTAVAQDANPIVFGIYYRCNQAQEAVADEVVQNTLGPIAQKHVDAGDLTGWAWFTHSQGGAWRRIFVTIGTDLGVMDYIWTGVSNSTPDPDLIGPATLSAYHSCERSREGRADEIFEEVLAPLYQKHMDLGHVASWGFYAHRLGGIFRRLETFSGADHTTLLNMQNAIYQEASETNALAMQEFNQICGWHTDYMWDNTTQQ